MMKYIEIKGENRPFSFGLRAINEFAKKEGVTFDHVMQNPTGEFTTLDALISIACISLNLGAQRQGEATIYTTDDVWDIADEDIGFIERVGVFMTESLAPIDNKQTSTFQKKTKKKNHHKKR